MTKPQETRPEDLPTPYRFNFNNIEELESWELTDFPSLSIMLPNVEVNDEAPVEWVKH